MIDMNPDHYFIVFLHRLFELLVDLHRLANHLHHHQYYELIHHRQYRLHRLEIRNSLFLS